ncbi:ATP-binding protein [Thalassovita sp.]|uniref:ATP-binding protein n=1 Tax=Thalassovita sp. TaxID=1979401 RepID=UPI002B267C68|nr:ATP-binding protein [Thalassovita sp.]
MAPDETIAFSFDGSAIGVRQALTRLMRDLQARSFNKVDRDNVELVLAEALNNIVEHGYRGGKNGKIDLCCTLRPEGVDIVVMDCGAAVPEAVLLPRAAPDPQTRMHDLPEGGWGWSMIHKLTGKLKYSREGDCNRLELHLPFSVDVRPGSGSD